MATQSDNQNPIKIKLGLFKFDLKDDDHFKKFNTIYNTHSGNWIKIKSELNKDKSFTPAMVKNLEFTHYLSEWSNDNKAVVELFQKDDKLLSMRDIALNFNKDAFSQKVKGIASGKSDEAKRSFTIALHQKLFQYEPTAVVVNMIKDPQVSVLNTAVGTNVARILEKRQDFNIRTHSIYEVLKNKELFKEIPIELHEPLQIELKTLQRIVAVSPVADAIPALYDAKLHTAFQISDIPPAQFKTLMSNRGLDEKTVLQIHTNAQQTRVRNEHALMALKEASQNTGIAMIDKSMKLDNSNHSKMASEAMDIKNAAFKYTPDQATIDSIEKHYLSWDLLFGDADICECGECTSVYSAAAYYVELLQYLRNNNLDFNQSEIDPSLKIKADLKDISGTPLEKLFNRRPDLGCLELTCKNTNTILPYVDLVNEVMESYVAFKHLKPFNVEDETSSELLAEPQHTEYQAYCILKNEVYPFTLPYHQPINASRIYLDYLGTNRYEVIHKFRKNNVSNDTELTKLKDEALNGASDAEFLNITKEEYIILTKECFESKALMNKLKNKTFTDSEYEELIGVRSVGEYYGYDDDAAMLSDNGLTLIKKEFLRRTGIDYFNLVDLLRTEFINPLVPKGKSKTIMESLRFSYRFLQNYAKIHGIDKMAEDLVKLEKFADLLPILKDQIEILTNKKSLSCPGTCKDKIEISDKDIICWVKCHFEKIGKMIVIESGKGCVNGDIIFNNNSINYDTGDGIKVIDCKIFKTKGNYQSEIGQIDKKTGKVSVLNNEEIDTEKWKNIEFKGEKGEKGIFYVIDGEVYLVFLEQKDSCDLNTALLQHLDGSPLTIEEYDKMHRFIRLWRKLGWTIDEIDKAIIGLSEQKLQQTENNDVITDDSICDDCNDDCDTSDCDDCDCDECSENAKCNPNHAISTTLIHQLAAVKKLLDKTGIELIKLLAFWRDISTTGENSLYKRLFLTHNVLGIDKVFKANANGNYLTSNAKISEHTPVVMAALNYTADDLQAVMKATDMTDELTLSNLSILFRYRLLSKVLGYKIPVFMRIVPLLEKVFDDAHSTLKFIKNLSKIDDAGFTPQELNYIIRNFDDDKKPFKPTKKSILLLAKSIYDGLNTIDETHQDIKADAAITDAVLQKINLNEKATTEIVRAKASLLFETDIIEKVIGILEGSNIYITNAPKNIVYTLAEDKTLHKKLKYDKENGSVQITGILTEAESIDYKALNNDPNWASALNRIEKQQKKQFNELLSKVFETEKTKTDVQKTALQTIIKAGDISVPIDKIPDGEPDINTAPQKRTAFLEIFMPYLRQELSHRFIVNTLSGIMGLQSNITDILISDILKIGSTPVSLFSIFEKIKESSKPVESNWNGYLIPGANATYTFVIKNSDVQPVLSIDGTLLNFTVQEDPTNEWWSDDIVLQSGKLYKLSATNIELKNIHWKTTASAITAVPSSALIPDFASQQCEPALIALKKMAMLVTNFNLSTDEIQFLKKNKVHFDNLDFNLLTFPHWLRLDAYTRLRNSLPQSELNLLDFWNWTYNPASDVTLLSGKIAELTTWKKERIDKLTDTNHFNIRQLKDYHNEKNLLKLQCALTVVDKISVDIDLLFDWAIPTSKFNKCRIIADSIKNAIRAKYNQTDWEQVIKPLNDKLRNNQKEALIGFLLQQQTLIDWGVTDADGLFEYFLIDVQMDACMETSRIKQALSSVQLFVQRCFLGLEEEHSGINPDVLDRGRWEWMQRYRVWEANRKVFLYPENWIESNLRDDKSPFFKELESELLQKDINKQNVTDALKSYLYKIDEVANMEVVGLYIDGSKTGDEPWPKNSKLHVFSRTRNAPYFFFYRYLALDEMNWYPWEKMQVDIPSYDVEDANGVLIDNGCYLTPVAWNGRLLIFFPQIAKKTKPRQDSNVQNKTISHIGNNVTPEQLNPVEYYEIKLAWSEYRNGKWTQKQLSKDAADTTWTTKLPAIENFKLIPNISDNRGLIIQVEDETDADLKVFEFEFNGSQIRYLKTTGILPLLNPTIPLPKYFHKNNSTNLFLEPLLIKNGSWVKSPVLHDDNTTSSTIKLTNITNFYHPDTSNLLGEINLGKLNQFFQYNLKVGNDNDLTALQNKELKDDAFGFHYDNDSTSQNIFHELKRPYSLYNWELFLHTPLMLADALSKSQQFEEAMKWYHFVFNPIAEGSDDNRFWQFAPFKDINCQRILDSIFNNLKPNTADQTISEWRNKPFMPHLVARNRPVAYMKWVVMKYIDNLVAWGDYLFRQDTIESINQATQLYILAGHILGPRPMIIPKRGTLKPQTYIGLLDKWDAFGNAMVELELTVPFSNQTTLPFGAVNGELAFANTFGLASSLYFCIPNNPKLMGYWDTIADRLYKIRHCENIEGVFRKLPLFEPPIDPALLVKAAAQGLSIASVINDLNTPMPNYRFYYLLQKALELCGELKSMGNALLSAIEKKDNEAIALIRSKHESAMHNLVMEIKKMQLEEAQKNMDGLEQNRKSPEHRMKYYLQLIGEDLGKVPELDAEFAEIANSIEAPIDESGLKLISFEKEEYDKSHVAHGWQMGASIVEALSGIFHALPDATIAAMPFGIGGQAKLGGSHFGNAANAASKVIQIIASQYSFESSNAGKKGNFKRALQDRVMQANAAGYEIKQIDKQITAQKIRIAIANQEIANQQKMIDNAMEVEEFLKNKYTNEELYTWMRGSLKTLYHQVYSLAYELSRKAEKVYRFERGISNSNFIQAGYWDAGRDGLLAGEQLYVGLKQLEAAYQNERGYDYEITKHVSLCLLSPLALIQLRETGKCEFEIPEVLFDMDYPGQYKRRIKSVSVSMPCIVGPYTGVNAKFSLLENKFRNTAIGGKTYEENTDETDDRFSTYRIPINAIATSTGQNDSGMFELNFKDERYLPFEGAGVISKWCLELPEIRQFDYATIADVIIHIRYTANEGGERLKLNAAKTVFKQLENIKQQLNETGLHLALNMKHDFPNEWHLFKKSVEVELNIDKTRLPYLAQTLESVNIEQVMFLAKVKDNPAGFTININESETIDLSKAGELNLYRGINSDIKLNDPFSLSIAETDKSKLEELLIVVKYKF
ncbi:neuraminidase-like domain-containing protein [Flavobacterium sp. H122]|uniref:Tc toxin subunit A-related protein n=1 Tax=Flavobacterium sp. H122 TaxID=2529860 RepID=UPI0010AA9660|nr:neuraminidase-like domain-containing protein [Flavobacterium sp. H122]